jgi:glucosylceramidase
MRRWIAALLAAACLPAATARAADTAQVWLTDGHAHLARQGDLAFSDGTGGASVTVDVDPSRTAQRFRGVGAAFTDSTLYLLSKLSAERRRAVLEALLDGAGMSVMRVPMGASDFTASGVYSYDDGPADPALARFSIAHDQAYVLPILREALAIKPSLKLLANPWSPPGWMKTSGSMVGPGTLRPDDYDALAQYFVRFLEAYRDAGVPIWAVTPQNEPLQPTADYPGMQMTAAEEALFVRDHLVPALRAAHLRTRVYGYDYVWLGSEGYVPPLLTLAGGALDGIAYHCYFGAPESQGALHALFPAPDVIEDECSTGISVLSPVQVLVRSLLNGASTVLMWNAALDPSGGPKIGSGCFTCIGLFTVDPARNAATPTGGYWQLAHAGRFVARGARRIATTASPPQPPCAAAPGCGLETVAFRKGRSTTVIATNSGVRPVTFALRRPDGRSVTYTLRGQNGPSGTDVSNDAAVATFVWTR